MTDYPDIRAALTAINSMDEDRAQKLNGVGFSKVDGDFARSILEQPRWSQRQAYAAYRSCIRYKRQLLARGIDVQTIPVVEKPGPKVTEAQRRTSSTQPVREVSSDGKSFLVRFPYSDGHGGYLKTRCRGRRWDPDRKVWVVDASVYNMDALTELVRDGGMTWTESANVFGIEINKRALAAKEMSSAVESDFEVGELGGELFPFQTAGVEYATMKKKVLIADEMGLGKTVQAIATINHESAYPVLVVCPASLRLNWQREWQKWVPDASTSLVEKSIVPGCDVYIINYDIVWKADRLSALIGMGFKAVILDESHMCKDRRAKRTVACKELIKRAPIRLLLTGTPVLNRPMELISQLQMLGKLEDVGGFNKFVYHYCGGKKGHFGLVFNEQDAHLQELNEKLREVCMVRRLKADVLSELPEKRRVKVLVPITNDKEYTTLKQDLVEWMRGEAKKEADYLGLVGERATEFIREKAVTPNAEILVQLGRLREVSARGKMAAVKEWIENFLETGQKLVVFAHHREMIEGIYNAFASQAVMVYGGMDKDQRQDYIDAFQNDPNVRLFVGSIRAAGVGITLTAASDVAFIETGWTPADQDQAEDRLHRIGQRGSVTAWYFISPNTVDEWVYDLIKSKRGQVDMTVDGTMMKDLMDMFLEGC